MEIKIENDIDPKEMAKLKDLIVSINGVFPNRVQLRNVLVIETDDATVYKLLKDYGVTRVTKPLQECPQCHKQVDLITKQGICRPCLMNNARSAAKTRLEKAVDADHPLMAVRVG